MKNILKLLSLLTINPPLSPINLNVVTISNKHMVQFRAKLTTLGIKISNFYSLGATTGILQEKETNLVYFFNTNKINKTSKGILNLGIKFTFLSFIVPQFFKLSATTSIMIVGETNSAYFFDVNRVGEKTKGLIHLSHAIKNFYPLSTKTGIVIAISDETFFFDASKIFEPTKGLTYLTTIFCDFYRLTSTTGIFCYQDSETFFFDATKIFEPTKGLIKLTKMKQMAKFYQLSSTTGIFVARNTGASYFFDATKINELEQGIIVLGFQMVVNNFCFDNFLLLADSIALLKITNKLVSTNKNNNLVYFDATKINEPTKGLIILKQKSEKLSSHLLQLTNTMFMINAADDSFILNIK